MKKFLFLALTACAFAACSDDDPVTPTPPEPPTPPVPVVQTETVDFESAELGEAGFLWGKEQAQLGKEQLTLDGIEGPSTYFFGIFYTEKQARVMTYYTDYGHTDSHGRWNGFIISNHTDRETAGEENEKSVYAESGADGSTQFAVGCYGRETLSGKGMPTIMFRSLVKPVSVAVAAATYPYLYYNNTLTETVKPAFDLVISGLNNRTEIGRVTVPFVAGGRMTEGWQTVNLSEIGEVSSLEFTVECDDETAPTYFCLDNLTYEK